MAYEGLENFDSALETYLRASEFIHASQPVVSFYAVQFWISKVMYRLCMLSLRLQELSEAIIHFRQYKRFVDANPKANFGFRERLVVYYWYWRSLSEIVRRRIEDGFPDMYEKGGANGETGYLLPLDVSYRRTAGPRADFKELKDELLDIQSQYESILVEYTKFPRAGSTNNRYAFSKIFSQFRILEFVDRAMENWHLLGSDPVEAAGLVQACWPFLSNLIADIISSNWKDISFASCYEAPYVCARRKWELCRS
jgi:hypothetical protein